MIRLSEAQVVEIQKQAEKMYGSCITMMQTNCVIGALNRLMDPELETEVIGRQADDIELLKRTLRERDERISQLVHSCDGHHRSRGEAIRKQNMVERELVTEKQKTCQLTDLNTRQSNELTKLRTRCSFAENLLREIRNRIMEEFPVHQS